jgi:hypothetical protein
MVGVAGARITVGFFTLERRAENDVMESTAGIRTKMDAITRP